MEGGEFTLYLNSPRMANPPRSPKHFPGSNINEATRGGVLLNLPQQGRGHRKPRFFVEHDMIAAPFASRPTRGDLLVLANELSIGEGWSVDRFEEDEKHGMLYRNLCRQAEAEGSAPPQMPAFVWFFWVRRTIEVFPNGDLCPAPGAKFVFAARRIQERNGEIPASAITEEQNAQAGSATSDEGALDGFDVERSKNEAQAIQDKLDSKKPGHYDNGVPYMMCPEKCPCMYPMEMIEKVGSTVRLLCNMCGTKVETEVEPA